MVLFGVTLHQHRQLHSASILPVCLQGLLMCEFKRIFRLTSHLGIQIEGCGLLQGSPRMLLARWQPTPPMSSSDHFGIGSEAGLGFVTARAEQLRLGR